MLNIQTVDVDLIDMPEEIMRRTLDPDALTELSLSLKALGQLQPIVIKQNRDRYILCIGFRRLTATRMMGQTTIIADIKDPQYDPAEAATLVENIQREQLPIVDEARAVRKMIDVHGWGIPKTAQTLGKSESWVRARLDILRLPDILLRPLQSGELGLGVALELARIPDEHVRDVFTGYAVQGGCTLLQAQRWRTTAERDIEAGYLDRNPEPTPPEPGEQRREVYVMECGLCNRQFPGDRVRIIKTCPRCFETIREETESAQPQTPDQVNDSQQGQRQS